DAAAIAAVKERTGHQHLQVRGNQVCKDRELELDISGLAAGYMVDRVAERLIAMGIESYMVELTGELRADGLKPGGLPWRIAVEEPRDESRVAQLVLPLRGYSVSTSGDYRNFFEQDGMRYSHTFDPVSGSPVLQDLAAVTVLHPSAAWAEGRSARWRGEGSGQGWADGREHDLAARAVSREAAGFGTRTTPGLTGLQQGEESSLLWLVRSAAMVLCVGGRAVCVIGSRKPIGG